MYNLGYGTCNNLEEKAFDVIVAFSFDDELGFEPETIVILNQPLGF